MEPGFEARALEFGAGFADFFGCWVQREQGHRKPGADALAWGMSPGPESDGGQDQSDGDYGEDQSQMVPGPSPCGIADTEYQYRTNQDEQPGRRGESFKGVFVVQTGKAVKSMADHLFTLCGAEFILLTDGFHLGAVLNPLADDGDGFGFKACGILWVWEDGDWPLFDGSFDSAAAGGAGQFVVGMAVSSTIHAEEVSLVLGLGKSKTTLLPANRAVVGSDSDGANTQHRRTDEREGHS